MKIDTHSAVPDPTTRNLQIGVIVPTYNARQHWRDLQASLDRQGVSGEQVLIVDSSSQDGTADLARSSGYRFLSIRKEEFGHGATRQMAVGCFPAADLLVFLTQDVILPDTTSLENLCKPFCDETVGAAYGRQAPRHGAGPIERHARLFNYPGQSHVMTFQSRERYGIKAAFCSNSFAGYRRSALMAVGGFPADVLLAEDSVVAAKLLMAGWKVVYEASALAVHSHPLRLSQEFSRYFDTGAHHSRESWLLDTFGKASSEGKLFLKSEVQYLLENAPAMVPIGLLRTLNKLAGYQLGRVQRHLPDAVTRRVSGYPAFWASDRSKASGAEETTPQPERQPGKAVLSESLEAAASAVNARPIDASGSM